MAIAVAETDIFIEASGPKKDNYNPDNKNWSKKKIGTYKVEQISSSPLEVKVSGNYDTSLAPYGPGGDAQHSFQSRLKDKFGGQMNTITNSVLLSIYNEVKINPKVISIDISIGEIVNWSLIIKESDDGKAYIGISSRGGAGNALNRKDIDDNVKKKKDDIPGEIGEKSVDFNTILDYKNSSKDIRQVFFQYTSPTKYPPIDKSAATATNTSTSSGATTGGSTTTATTANNSKIKLSKKSGPGELMGVVEFDIKNNLCFLEGIQFDQPGEYVILVTPSDDKLEATEFKITVGGDPLPPSSEKPAEEKDEGSRPVIAQIDPPTIKLKPIEFEAPQQDNTALGDIATSIGTLPFVWFNGVNISERDISSFILYHDGIVPCCDIRFTDTSGVLSRDGFPLDNSTFQIFLNPHASALKYIHMSFKVINFKQNKDKSYTANGKIDLKDFYKINFKSYVGTSYDVLRNISKELEIGFNTNITSTDDSMKWTNVGKNYSEFMQSIVRHSYISDSSFILSYIDFYYCFNFVDLEKEWSRDISKDIGVDSGGVARFSSANEEDRIVGLTLTNDKTAQGTSNYISEVVIDNSSTAISTRKGQFTTTKYYDTSSKSFLVFDVDSISSTDDSKLILKGKPGDDKEMKENYRTTFGGRFDFANVHKNYVYARTQNRRNLDNLSRITCKITLPGINYNLYKFQKVKILFSSQAPTVSDPDIVKKRLSGDWIIVDMRYVWDGKASKHELICARKELEKLPEEMETQATQAEPEKKTAENPNDLVDTKPPNSLYEVGEIYMTKTDDGRIFKVTVESLLENGDEITATVVEVDPELVSAAAETGTTGTTETGTTAGTTETGTTTGTTETGTPGTNTQTSATESETKLLNFIASKRQKGHEYIGYKTYDVTASDISKLKSIADKYGIPIEWLSNLINHETAGTWNPAIRNSINATGLIQFLPSTAKGYGYTVSQLQKMTFSEQLDVVDAYLNKNAKPREANNKVKSSFTQTDLFMAIFYPAAKGNPNYKFPNKVTKNNPGIYTPLDYAEKATDNAPFKSVPNDLASYVKQYGKDNLNNENIA